MNPSNSLCVNSPVFFTFAFIALIFGETILSQLFNIGFSVFATIFVLGYFKTWYYQDLFSNKFDSYHALFCGGILAFMIEGARFSFMMSSAQDLLNRNNKGLVFGFLGSIGLFIYEMFLCGSLGSFWSVDSSLYSNIFRFVASLGMVIELRLCLMLVETKEEEIEEEDQKNEDTIDISKFSKEVQEAYLLDQLSKLKK